MKVITIILLAILAIVGMWAFTPLISFMVPEFLTWFFIPNIQYIIFVIVLALLILSLLRYP